MASTPLLPPGNAAFTPEQFGPYTLVRPLAKGGMGELFLAQRDGLAGFSKQLVVKRLRPELAEDRQFVDMFLTEGRVAALIDHPNVVHLYDFGELEGSFYLAMEYIAGKDLGAVLTRLGGPLDLSLSLFIMNSLCGALAFAHEAVSPEGQHLGLVHRDINPANVLISYSGHVALTDFGIAKVRAATMGIKETRVGVLKGKFGYLSPEQAHGRAVDRRSDIYNLGLVLFEMTTGQRAMAGDTDGEMIVAALDGATRRPRDLDPSYPGELEQIYLRAVARAPDDRYPNATELQEAIAALQNQWRLGAPASRLGELMHRLFGSEQQGAQAGATRPPAVGAGAKPADRPRVAPAVRAAPAATPAKVQVTAVRTAPSVLGVARGVDAGRAPTSARATPKVGVRAPARSPAKATSPTPAKAALAPIGVYAPPPASTGALGGLQPETMAPLAALAGDGEEALDDDVLGDDAPTRMDRQDRAPSELSRNGPVSRADTVPLPQIVDEELPQLALPELVIEADDATAERPAAVRARVASPRLPELDAHEAPMAMVISRARGAGLPELDAREVPTVMEWRARGLLPLGPDEGPTILDQRASPGIAQQQSAGDLPYLVVPVAGPFTPAHGPFAPELAEHDAGMSRATPWRLIALALALLVIGLTITVILIVALSSRS